MEITFKISRVTVLTNVSGTDLVSIMLDVPTPFPEMGYDAYADIDVRKGYGVEWCQKVLGVSPEIIDGKTGVITPVR